LEKNEDVDGLARRPFLQLARELDPLRLPTRECGRRLTEAHVAQAHVVQRLQVTGDGRDVGEEPQGLLDRHLEHLGDRAALVVDLQRLPVVAPALAYLAGDIDVGQEVHLDAEGPVTPAGLAATALDVEGEPTRLVATHLGLAGGGEQFADVVEHAGVGRRVRPGGPPDRGLIDHHGLVDQLETIDALVLAG